jgi:hypothetical protein
MPIEASQTEENIKSHKGIMFKRQRVFDGYITTDNYEDSLIFDARLLKDKLIHIRNDHATNAAKVKILGCIDPSDWREILVETAIPAASKLAEQTNSLPYAYIKVQAKSSVAATPAKITALIAGLK